MKKFFKFWKRSPLDLSDVEFDVWFQHHDNTGSIYCFDSHTQKRIEIDMMGRILYLPINSKTICTENHIKISDHKISHFFRLLGYVKDAKLAIRGLNAIIQGEPYYASGSKCIGILTSKSYMAIFDKGKFLKIIK